MKETFVLWVTLVLPLLVAGLMACGGYDSEEYPEDPGPPAVVPAGVLKGIADNCQSCHNSQAPTLKNDEEIGKRKRALCAAINNKKMPPGGKDLKGPGKDDLKRWCAL